MSRLFFSLLILSLCAVAHAHAEPQPEDARVKHYAYDVPESTHRAVQLYYENLGIIRHALDSGAVDDKTLELIHERSYALETATDYLRYTHKENIDALTLLSHAVHEVHEASEDHEDKKIRPAFEALNKADDILDALPR
jgi:hypothetical protein